MFGQATCKVLPIGEHDLTLTVTDSLGIFTTNEFAATVLVPGQSGNGLPGISECGSNAANCTIGFPVVEVSVNPLTIDGEEQVVTIKDREVIFTEGGSGRASHNTRTPDDALPKKIV